MQRANDMPENCGFKARSKCITNVVALLGDNNDDTSFIQGIEQCLDLVKTANIQKWLNSYPNWIVPQDNKYFKEILYAIELKSDRAWMYTKSLTNVLDEMTGSTP
eukprot:3575738-Ditylum_brightwellii.AAC.1